MHACSTDERESKRVVVNACSSDKIKSKSVLISVNMIKVKDANNVTKNGELLVTDNLVIDAPNYFKLLK